MSYRLCQDGAVLVTLCLQGALGLLGFPQLGGQVLRAQGRIKICLAKHRVSPAETTLDTSSWGPESK